MTDASSFDCMLNIACPAGLEEEFIDLLRGQPERVSGFTLLPTEGFGVGMRQHSAMEQVRGRSKRRLLQILMQGAHVQPLLADLRARVQSEEVAWWTVPVTGFGRLA